MVGADGLLVSWLLLLQSVGSRRVGSRRAGFGSPGAWAQLLRVTWDRPRPGMEPVSPYHMPGGEASITITPILQQRM